MCCRALATFAAEHDACQAANSLLVLSCEPAAAPSNSASRKASGAHSSQVDGTAPLGDQLPEHEWVLTPVLLSSSDALAPTSTTSQLSAGGLFAAVTAASAPGGDAAGALAFVGARLPRGAAEAAVRLLTEQRLAVVASLDPTDSPLVVWYDVPRLEAAVAAAKTEW
jgi:hypothetical protein